MTSQVKTKLRLLKNLVQLSTKLEDRCTIIPPILVDDRVVSNIAIELFNSNFPSQYTPVINKV